MNLTIILPSRIEFSGSASRVGAHGSHGRFSLLPRHIDTVAKLTAGLVSFQPDGEDKLRWLAIDGGILVKRDKDVYICTTNAASGELGELETQALAELKRHRSREQQSEHALRKIEADFLNRFSELDSDEH